MRFDLSFWYSFKSFNIGNRIYLYISILIYLMIFRLSNISLRLAEQWLLCQSDVKKNQSPYCLRVIISIIVVKKYANKTVVLVRSDFLITFQNISPFILFI